MKELLSEAFMIGAGPQFLGPHRSGYPVTVRAVDHGVSQEVVLTLAGLRSVVLDWSEADALSSMLSRCADAIYEEVRR